MNILPAIEAYCQHHGLINRGDKIVVAVSGGMDSVRLLTILRKMATRHDLQLYVAHLNHGMRNKAADADADFVKDISHRWKLPTVISRMDVPAYAKQQKCGLETAARQVRYKFLADVAQKVAANKIAVGHQANDQAETILMNFLRGAGVTGLQGMQPITTLDLKNFKTISGLNKPNIFLIRPLLNTTRNDIKTFCHENHLAYRCDLTNQDITFYRNRIRHELIPLLETYNPNIVKTLLRTGNIMTADNVVLQEQIRQNWQTVLITETDDILTFDLEKWQRLPLAIQRGLLRHAIHVLHHSLVNVGFIHIDQAITLLNYGQTGRKFVFPTQLILTILYNRFILKLPDRSDKAHFVKASFDAPIRFDAPVNLIIHGVIPLPDTNWIVETCMILSKGFHPMSNEQKAYFDADCLGEKPYLRTRQAGDKFYPYGLEGHSQTLKKFMINHKIPASHRDNIPLLVAEDGKICWVVGWRTGHWCQVTKKTKRILQIEIKKKVNTITHDRKEK